MTEKELKLTIDAAGYRTLLEHFQKDILDDLDQWSIFFDTTNGTCLRSRLALRLRSIASLRGPLKWFATVKRPGFVHGGVWVRPEIEAELPADSARAILLRPSLFYQKAPPEIQQQIAQAKDEQFVVVADFRMLRRIVLYEGLHLECDESVLPDGTVFHEIECETEEPERAKSIIKAKLRELGIAFEASITGKFGRLRELPAEKRQSRPFGIGLE
jgi:adenylate cyclase class IV